MVTKLDIHIRIKDKGRIRISKRYVYVKGFHEAKL